jgi:hypothetical protein
MQREEYKHTPRQHKICCSFSRMPSLNTRPAPVLHWAGHSSFLLSYHMSESLESKLSLRTVMFSLLDIPMLSNVSV